MDMEDSPSWSNHVEQGTLAAHRVMDPRPSASPPRNVAESASTSKDRGANFVEDAANFESVDLSDLTEGAATTSAAPRLGGGRDGIISSVGTKQLAQVALKGISDLRVDVEGSMAGVAISGAESQDEGVKGTDAIEHGESRSGLSVDRSELEEIVASDGENDKQEEKADLRENADRDEEEEEDDEEDDDDEEDEEDGGSESGVDSGHGGEREPGMSEDGEKTGGGREGVEDEEEEEFYPHGESEMMAHAGGSIVGDVLYSMATGEEEGRPRQRMLAFAAKRYQAAVERNPGDYDALYNWALVLQESADNCDSRSAASSKDALLEEACKKYAAATRLCPTLHEAFYNWAIAITDRAKLRRRTKDAQALWEEACQKYDRSVRLNWDSPQALNNWGLALQELGAIVPIKEKMAIVKKAISKFRAAIRLRYDFHRAVYNLGTVLYGRTDDIDRELKKLKAKRELIAGSAALDGGLGLSAGAAGGSSASSSLAMDDPSWAEKIARREALQEELYNLSAVYICAAHALKPDHTVYRTALTLVQNKLPRPYLKKGFLLVPPSGNLLAPHDQWTWRHFVLNHEALFAKNKDDRRVSDSFSSRRLSTMGMNGGSFSINGLSASSFDGIGSGQPTAQLTQDWRVEMDDILSINPCADLSLPAGGGMSIETVNGQYYLVAETWETMDGWVDAIRLVYTIYIRGRTDSLIGVLTS